MQCVAFKKKLGTLQKMNDEFFENKTKNVESWVKTLNESQKQNLMLDFKTYNINKVAFKTQNE